MIFDRNPSFMYLFMINLHSICLLLEYTYILNIVPHVPSWSPHGPYISLYDISLIFHYISFLQTISWPYPINNIKIISYYNILFSYYIIIISILSKYIQIISKSFQIKARGNGCHSMLFYFNVVGPSGLNVDWRHTEDNLKTSGDSWGLIEIFWNS